MSAERPKSEYERLLKEVGLAIDALVAASSDGTFLPADVKGALLAAGRPLGAWEVRGALTELERRGQLSMDPATCRWQRHSPPAASVSAAS